MSKKAVELEAVNAIDIDGESIKPRQLFKCSKKESERLIELGAARVPVPDVPGEPKEKPEQLTVEILRKNHPNLVKQIEAEAREGYVSHEEASKDFDALRKELDEARAKLDEVSKAQK